MAVADVPQARKGLSTTSSVNAPGTVNIVLVRSILDVMTELLPRHSMYVTFTYSGAVPVVNVDIFHA